ncbi:MAG: sulfite exporter TauE/SafE family protein [Crocinitomicaceae bacterium]|nr:sulfite exporter TauE/SafE family protein [Crocinitomicaceae bacterium]MBT5404140.1 sulfite exporter TauE/SafE family protein [Crocinitomicaceae bacterium]MBT6030041.1 sulfite exporter TauE/SafE family protein [Crocinitomicaceae bacterium]
MEEYVAYGLAFFIGVVLGLIGGGGSILTVPVFVYLLGIKEEIATAYSLFVVGIVALVGGLRYLIKQQVDLKTAIIFAIPAVPAVYATRKFIVPAIPEVIYRNGDFEFTKGMFIMLLFSIVMIAAAISMVRGRRDSPMKTVNVKTSKYNYLMIFFEGIFVGAITGLVGAGGGFLIVPALVLLAKIPMKIAVGTSLLIIAIKSLVGFLGDLNQGYDIDWYFLVLFSSVAIVGVFIGAIFNSKVPARILKKGFGWFVLMMAIVILFLEIF